MPVNENDLKQLAVKVNLGSGCLYQPATKDYTYVLTVRHNVATQGTNLKMPSIKVSRSEGIPFEYVVDPNDVFLHPDVNIDLAILKIPYTEIVAVVHHAKASRNDRLRIWGFPDIKAGQVDQSGTFLMTADISNAMQFQAIGDMAFSTTDFSSAENVIGFSGSGVFDEHSSRPMLKGIMPALEAPGGAHNRLNVYHISALEAIISANGLMAMTPFCLLSFESYIVDCFGAYPDEIQGLLSEKSNELLLHFNPFSISESVKEKLFIPYSIDYASHLLKAELWKGWLSLLTFLWIVDSSNMEVGQVVQLLHGPEKIHIRYFHSEDPRMSNIVHKILIDAYESIEPRDNIVVYSDVNPKGPKYFTEEKLCKMIINVCSPNKTLLQKNDIDISNPGSIKPISIMHLEHLGDEIACTPFESSFANFEASVKEKILTYLLRKQ